VWSTVAWTKPQKTEDLSDASDFFRMKRAYCKVTLILPLGLPFKTTILIKVTYVHGLALTPDVEIPLPSYPAVGFQLLQMLTNHLRFPETEQRLHIGKSAVNRSEVYELPD